MESGLQSCINPSLEESIGVTMRYGVGTSSPKFALPRGVDPVVQYNVQHDEGCSMLPMSELTVACSTRQICWSLPYTNTMYGTRHSLIRRT